MKQPAAARLPTFEPIQSPRAFEIVCERIREQVADGRLKRGDKLPPERLLAEQLGVSRLAIREALRSLENAGLVVLERGPKGGAFIQGGSDGQMTELMQDMMALGTITLSDLTEARIFILGSVARLACERATEEDIRLIEENVKMNEVAIETGSRETRLAHATEFYTRLAFATKNRVMMLVVRSLTDTIREVLQRIEIYPSKELAQSRWRFMRALKARNAERAAQEMSSHLRKLHEHVVRHAAAQKKSPDIRPRSRS
jgi:GntR family transcriptional repressor for pyruvate dehydrogenase complex